MKPDNRLASGTPSRPMPQLPASRPAPQLPSPSLAPPHWECRWCKTDLPPADGEFIQYGQDGWEPFAVVPIPYDPGQALYFFKRRRT